MKSQEIRRSFVDFFARHDHEVVSSAPLVPHGDPTLLFTNAGMVQFKDYFLGTDEPASPRAVSVQKCLRVSGKHNDLENVGPSPRHHTFFEMLGNFSFGDYFKAEAIELGWQLVTEIWGLPPEHLSATVFEEDDEAAELWAKISGLDPRRIHRAGEKDNFWAMGETGPCGPCSEIFIDVDPDRPEVDWEEGTESGRYLELWNLVFMQYSRDAAGEMEPLPNPSIDTGAGLERLAAVLQGVESNYDSDLFQPLLAAAATLAERDYGARADDDVSLRVIADHLRAVSFLLADGVIPTNDGRGYVLRRILRRAVRHGMRLGLDEPFLHRLVPVLGEVMGREYPELGETEAASVATVRAEEEKFLSTVAVASTQVQEAIDAAREEGGEILSGETVFRFYDTYGLPLELIEEIAEEEQFGVDREGFERSLEEQRARSRSAGAESQLAMGAVEDAIKEIGRTKEIDKTEFVGYDSLEATEVPVEALVAVDRVSSSTAARGVNVLGEGDEGYAVLGRTPFYAESGGQVGDRGVLLWGGGRAEVVDTQKTRAGVFLHRLRVEEGKLAEGALVTARVDASRRRPTERNHTATHLLHAALRHFLGESVRQAGSLVAPDRLRFDFTFSRPLEDGEIAAIEELVNSWVLAAEPTEIVADRPFEEAVEAGAMALFGEKYGDRVRTVAVPPIDLDGERVESLELCGGCHVANTGAIGPFRIVSERGVASGVRRIEALTGEAALEKMRRERRLLAASAASLDAETDDLPAEIDRLKERLAGLEAQLSELRLEMVAGGNAAGENGESTVSVDGVEILSKLVPPAPAAELRTMADVLRSRLGSGVVVLGSREEGKAALVVAVTDDLSGRLHAGKLARSIAERVDGSGGGRADFAQAGGRSPEKLEEALAGVGDLVRSLLAGETARGS